MIFSILIVLLSSWVVGNLMNIDGGVDTEPLFEERTYESTLLIFILILISFPIIYTSYVLYDKDSISMLTGLMLLGFWILSFFGAVLIFTYPAALLSVGANFSFSPPTNFPSLPFIIDLGFLLLIFLSGSVLAYSLYLKIFSGKDKNEEKYSTIDPINGAKIEEKKKEDEIEESLSSTLDKAIDELHEGEEIRSTIIRCYREMSHILETSGAQNDDFKTPREFKDETIKKIPVQEEVISDITYLFEEARYSPHQLGENKRDRALQHLEKLKEGLL